MIAHGQDGYALVLSHKQEKSVHRRECDVLVRRASTFSFVIGRVNSLFPTLHKSWSDRTSLGHDTDTITIAFGMSSSPSPDYCSDERSCAN